VKIASAKLIKKTQPQRLKAAKIVGLTVLQIRDINFRGSGSIEEVSNVYDSNFGLLDQCDVGGRVVRLTVMR